MYFSTASIFIKIIRGLLFPFSILFFILVWLKNKTYEWGILKSKSYDAPIILVGNILAGGTGKTPMVAYLIQLLSEKYKTATLSRGYGRKTKGFLIADDHSNSDQIGDEPFQLYQNYGSTVQIAVCEDRKFGIEQLLSQNHVLLLDDAYQHRSIKAGLQIVLNTYDSLMKPLFMLPTGNLREPLSACKRADILIITKCPFSINENIKKSLKKKINPLSHQKLYFSKINYLAAQSVFNQEQLSLNSLKNKKAYVFTGIANDQPFLEFLESLGLHLVQKSFPDHYEYQEKELVQIITEFNALNDTAKFLITTEKDAQRLKNTKYKNLFLNLPLYYIPIGIEFLDNDGGDFNKTIENYVEANPRNG